MTNEFKDALPYFEKCWQEYAVMNPDERNIAHVRAIRRALLIADKLTQEPSIGMQEVEVFGAVSQENPQNIEEGLITSASLVSVFKAMRDQMLKEVGE
jgi:hypothetical protein